MTLDEINQQLAAMATSGDPVFANAANYIGQATAAAQAGQMSTQDLAEILRDTQRQLSIIQDMSQLAMKEQLNQLIGGLMTIIGAVY